MKDDRAKKLKTDLDQIESELLRLLKKHLPGAMDRDSLFFFTSEHQPTKYKMPAHWFRAYSEEILQLAKQSLILRRELVLPTENTPAALFLAACAESASDDQQKRGPRRLAKWLLQQLQA
jgi:hypothetical protein